VFTFQSQFPNAYPPGLFIYRFIKHWYEADAGSRAQPDFIQRTVQLLKAFDERQKKKKDRSKGPGPMEGVQGAPQEDAAPPRQQQPVQQPRPPRQQPQPAVSGPPPAGRQGAKTRVAHTPALAPASTSTRPAPARQVKPNAIFAELDGSEEEPTSDEDDAFGVKHEDGQKKERRDPVGTGYALEPPCENCAKAKRLCQEEIGGGACVDCFRLKYKCEYANTKGGAIVPKPKKRKITLEELRTVKPKADNEGGRKSRAKKGKGKQKVEEDSLEEDEAPGPPPKYVEVSDDPKPKRKRPQRKSKATAPAPAPAPTVDISNLVTIRKFYDFHVNTELM
jgi:hypothetical protein